MLSAIARRCCARVGSGLFLSKPFRVRDQLGRAAAKELRVQLAVAAEPLQELGRHFIKRDLDYYDSLREAGTGDL
jgi:hypothetical protein